MKVIDFFIILKIVLVLIEEVIVLINDILWKKRMKNFMDIKYIIN